jgi:AraC family transcriptional regulator
MRKRFQTIHDYHRFDPDIRVDSVEFAGLRVSLLREGSGDVTFTRTNRSGLVMSFDGTRTHRTRMDGITDNTPSHPGEVCLIPEGLDVDLAWENHAPVQTSVMVEFDATLFRTYVPELVTGRFLGGHVVPANFAARPALSGLMRVLAREVDRSAARGRLFADAAIRLLALELADTAWTVKHAARAERPVGPGDARIARAIDYAEAMFASDISVADLAAVAGLSPSQFTRAFRAATGRTPYAFVLDRRLSHAVRMLATTDVPVAVVAVDSGFVDQAHLTRMLRARYGRTPGQVRGG